MEKNKKIIFIIAFVVVALLGGVIGYLLNNGKNSESNSEDKIGLEISYIANSDVGLLADKLDYMLSAIMPEDYNSLDVITIDDLTDEQKLEMIWYDAEFSNKLSIVSDAECENGCEVVSLYLVKELTRKRFGDNAITKYPTSFVDKYNCFENVEFDESTSDYVQKSNYACGDAGPYYFRMIESVYYDEEGLTINYIYGYDSIGDGAYKDATLKEKIISYEEWTLENTLDYKDKFNKLEYKFKLVDGNYQFEYIKKK